MMRSREEMRAFTAQLAIRVSEELAEILEPAGLSLLLLSDSIESYFDELWPVQDDPIVVQSIETSNLPPPPRYTPTICVRPPPRMPLPLV